MPKLDLDQHRRNYAEALEGKKALYLERPAVFSPAAAAQDAANRSRMLWSWAPIWQPWEYTNWMEEGRSFHDTAYIGDWSGLVKVRFKGPQAFEFLHYVGTNDFSNFPVGRVKHHVQVNENGKIAAQGVLYRLADDEFMYTGGSTYWTQFMLGQGKWDAEGRVETPDYFLFSVQGPNSLNIMERATESKLAGLHFNQWGTFPIGGAPVKVLRTGITGELGYELHGPSEYGNSVWSRVVEVGQDLEIMQVGVRAQMISHVEAGIATNDRDFVSAAATTPGAPRILPTARSKRIGSYASDDISDLFRTPLEVGWVRQVSLDTHDFVGRSALLAEREAGGPKRRLVGLIWDNHDVVDVFATLFDDEPVAPMELPRYIGLAVDQVTSSGKPVGCSTSRVYSPFLRRMISLGYLDSDLAQPGTAVTVIWGEPGRPQREIKASVVELPFKPDTRRKDA
jgi:vanillate/3-O-methylgallate O-demethylase